MIQETSAIDSQQFHSFLELHNFPRAADDCPSLEVYWASLSWSQQQETGTDFAGLLELYQAHADALRPPGGTTVIESLTVLRGRDKDGNAEVHDLHFKPGDVVCLVGPTGGGKSRLLADIECLAQRDTPTRRKVLINGGPPDSSNRFSGESGLVAQITQNMNFVMDLSVEDFLHMHAESRELDNPGEVVARVLRAAISMAGEPFGPHSQITQLSGGQSRSLMIADAAFLSPKPIVLIDEIENAGVDRNRALRLFVEKGKIVLLSTHDPILALSGDRRLVIANGAVKDVIVPSAEEREACERLRQLDQTIARTRDQLRNGERIQLELER